MPIRSFLGSQAFDPELVAVMSAAFESACTSRGLRAASDDPATRMVAAKIIELVQDGLQDLEGLRAKVLHEFTA